MNMDKDTIVEVVHCLCGKSNPLGEERMDAERMDNLEKQVSVALSLLEEISGNCVFLDSPFASQRKVAQKSLDSLKLFGKAIDEIVKSNTPDDEKQE